MKREMVDDIRRRPIAPINDEAFEPVPYLPIS